MSRNRIRKPALGAGRGLQRVFAAGFLFFFLKGMLWLALGGLALTGLV